MKAFIRPLRPSEGQASSAGFKQTRRTKLKSLRSWRRMLRLTVADAATTCTGCGGGGGGGVGARRPRLERHVRCRSPPSPAGMRTPRVAASRARRRRSCRSASFTSASSPGGGSRMIRTAVSTRRMTLRARADGGERAGSRLSRGHSSVVTEPVHRARAVHGGIRARSEIRSQSATRLIGAESELPTSQPESSSAHPRAPHAGAVLMPWPSLAACSTRPAGPVVHSTRQVSPLGR